MPISAYYAPSRNLELVYSVLRRRAPPGACVCMVHIAKDVVRISSIPSIAFLVHCVFLYPSRIHSRRVLGDQAHKLIRDPPDFLLSRAYSTQGLWERFAPTKAVILLEFTMMIDPSARRHVIPLSVVKSTSEPHSERNELLHRSARPHVTLLISVSFLVRSFSYPASSPSPLVRQQSSLQAHDTR